MALSLLCTVCSYFQLTSFCCSGPRVCSVLLSLNLKAQRVRLRGAFFDRHHSALTANNKGEGSHAVNIKPNKSTGPQSEVPALFALSQCRYQ